MNDVTAQSGDSAAAAAPGAPAAPPSTAAEARAQRDADIQNPAFREALDRGDIGAKTRWNAQRDLISGPDPTDAVARAMSSEEPQGIIQNSDDVEMRGLADFYRGRGFNEVQTAEVLSNKPHTQAEKDMAATSRQQQLKSKEFQARFNAGEPDAMFDWSRNRAILASPLKSE